MDETPRLRPLDFKPIVHEGQQMWYLRDPLELSDYQIVMPLALAQILMFCDGAHTIPEIHEAWVEHLGIPVKIEIAIDTIEQLDEACLFENERSQQAIEALRQAYRAQPFRPPALAGLSYPESPQHLSQMLDSYGNGDDLHDWEPWYGRAIIAPHIDYQRGGSVYSKVYRRAETAVLAADLVIIFGTDHNGGPGTFTLTRQSYATPYGVLPTDSQLVDTLANAIGPEVAYAEELNHRQEHSIELAANWLHYIYERAGVLPKPMIPILIGSFQHFVSNGHHPAEDELLMTAIETLKRETAVLNVFTIMSVDFAHVGPAFDDNYVMDTARRTTLKQTDDQLVQSIIRGDETSFYNQIAAIQNSNKVCGFSPIYLGLKFIGRTEGIQVAYDQCEADEENNSLVSIAGILLE